jgi:hypothetical protein
MLKNSIESQAGFVAFGGPIKLRPNKNMREALRSLHARAESLRWNLGERLFFGSIAGVVLELLIDKTLIEVKTVKDFSHHSEHVAQLLAYFLMTALPVNRHQNVTIDKIGIYYSRHGELAVQDVSRMRRFANKDLPRIAEMFFEQFIQWRVEPTITSFLRAGRMRLPNQAFKQLRLRGFHGLTPFALRFPTRCRCAIRSFSAARQNRPRRQHLLLRPPLPIHNHRQLPRHLPKSNLLFLLRSLRSLAAILLRSLFVSFVSFCSKLPPLTIPTSFF